MKTDPIDYDTERQAFIDSHTEILLAMKVTLAEAQRLPIPVLRELVAAWGELKNREGRAD